jgi:hypothetical protein
MARRSAGPYPRRSAKPMKRKYIFLLLVVLAVVLGIEMKLGLFQDNNPRKMWASYIRMRNLASYTNARNNIFDLDPGHLGLKEAALDSDIWGLLLEISGDAKESLLVLKDGTVKYFASDGFEISGLNLVNDITEYSDGLYSLALTVRPYCIETLNFPVAFAGHYRLYIFTFSSILTTENCVDENGINLEASHFYLLDRTFRKLISSRRDILPSLIKSLKAEHRVP